MIRTDINMAYWKKINLVSTQTYIHTRKVVVQMLMTETKDNKKTNMKEHIK